MVEAETEDVSARGLYIRTEALLPVGEETELRLTLPDGSDLVLPARVAHMLTPSSAKALGRHAGMGFEILGGESSARLKLRAHVDSLRTEITNPGLSTTTQIVVVEPSAPLRTRMVRSLESAGFKVTACASATDALEACTQWRPDTVVAASSLESMTGIDLAYAMSDHETLSDVPLILTGDDTDLGRLEAYRAGVRDYIPTPFLEEELVIRVHRVAAPVTPTTNPGLRGSLVDIGLGTLLSLFEFERKSGILLLLRGGDIARVFVSEGKILKVEASAGRGTPRERLMLLLDWRDGQFEFSPCSIGGRDEVGTTVTQLLLEHARISDEADANRAAPIPRR
ncbi:MAG: putative two-component system response regulator [Myxococcales bacterium]|nr:putative two-component system response regulator [Myxococcales bacterium]